METAVLKCEFCTDKFSSKQEWKMHMKAQHGMTVYVCDLCPKLYYGESEYIQHFDADHKSEFNRHTCSFCGVSYKWFKFLEQHIKKKHQVNNLKQCKKCGEEFYNTMVYQRHLKLKHAPGRVFHKCTKCHRSFTAKSYVVLHDKFDHNPKGLKYFREYASEKLTLESNDLLDDLTKCSKCNLEYSSALYLYRHFKFVHNKKKFYQCCKCQDAVYGTRSGLTIHLFHEHNVSREHKCATCTTALFKQPSNKKVKKEVVKPVDRNKNGPKATEDGPTWSNLFIKQGIPEDLELNDANEVEISNLRNNIRSLFHILSTVPPSKLKGTTHSDLHVESVFSIHKMKCNDVRPTCEIEVNDTEEDDDDDKNERFLSDAVETENKKLKARNDRKTKRKIHGVLTVVKSKDGNERYQCDICHHEFSYRKGLKAHIISRHGFNGKFRRADSDIVEMEAPDKYYINDNHLEGMASLLVERMNEWAEMILPDMESEAIQTDETDLSQKENKCDVSQKDNDSDTSALVNKSDTMQKITKSENISKNTKSENKTPTVNKSNTLQKENKSASHEASNSLNKIKKSDTAPKHVCNKTQKNPKIETPQKAHHAKCDAVNKSNTNNKSETSAEVNYSKTPQSSEKNKKSTLQKDTDSGPPAKVKKCDATQKFNEIQTSPKLSKPTGTRQLKETSQKDTKSDISHRDIESDTPKKLIKSDATRKDNKSETSRKVNECESTQKINKSNSPQNEKSNTGPKVINSETTSKNKSNTIQKDTNSGTPSNVKNIDATVKVNKSTDTGKTKTTPLKDTKSDKYTKPEQPQNVLNPDATQKETDSKTSTKVNKSVTTQKVRVSNTPQKENVSGVCKVNNTVTKPKDKKSKTTQEDTISTLKKAKKSDAIQRELFSPKINISTSESITPDSPESVDKSAKTKNVTTTNYKCNFCQIEFEDQLHLLNHLTESHSDSEQKDGKTIFKCTECGIAFQQEDSLDAHVKEQHPKKNTSSDFVPNTCDMCNKTFNDKRGLKLHKLRTHNVKNIYSCKKCNFKHSNKRKLRNHPCMDDKQNDIEPENNEEKPVQCKENSSLKEEEYEKIKNKLLMMCKKEINSKRSQQDDQKRIHKCLKCESKFPKRTSLLNHIKNEHKINLFKLYKCEKCNSVFKMADKLKQHIKMKHKTVQESSNIPVIKINKSKMSPIKLSNGKMPNILSNLFYLNGKMHTCRVCNSYFPSSELLQRHVEWEHTQNVNLHKCGQCSQVLYNVEDLEMHMANAHNNTDGIFKWKKQIAFNYEQQTDL